MPIMMLFFSLIYLLCKILPFPYLFSFDEPWSISDLGLNCNLRTIEYGGNIGILPYWIYVFGRIEGIIWKMDTWVLLPLTRNLNLGIIIIIKVLLAWVNWGKHGIHVVGMKLDLCKIWQEYWYIYLAKNWSMWIGHSFVNM